MSSEQHQYNSSKKELGAEGKKALCKSCDRMVPKEETERYGWCEDCEKKDTEDVDKDYSIGL